MHQRILYKSEKPSELIYVSYSELESDFVPIVHTHPILEIIYIASGSGYINVENKKYRINGGSTIVIDAGTQHYEESDKNSLIKMYAIGVKDFETASNENIFIFLPSVADGRAIGDAFTFIFDEMKSDLSAWEEIVNSYVSVIMNKTKRYVNIEKTNKAVSSTGLTESAKRIIDSKFYSNIRGEEIAKMLSVSYSTLIHTFKKETGVTVSRYKSDRQIEEAKSLLMLTDLPISQIALNVGFNTCAYFTKTFKSGLSMTPKEFRAQNKFR